MKEVPKLTRDFSAYKEERDQNRKWSAIKQPLEDATDSVRVGTDGLVGCNVILVVSDKEVWIGEHSFLFSHQKDCRIDYCLLSDKHKPLHRRHRIRLGRSRRSRWRCGFQEERPQWHIWSRNWQIPKHQIRRAASQDQSRDSKPQTEECGCIHHYGSGLEINRKDIS